MIKRIVILLYLSPRTLSHLRPQRLYVFDNWLSNLKRSFLSVVCVNRHYSVIGTVSTHALDGLLPHVT